VKEMDDKVLTVSEAIKKYDPKKPYTYADYASWDDDVRCELIDGEIVVMDAPSFDHQRVLMELSRQVANFLVGKRCVVLPAPFDVCLFGLGDEDTTVVQPDIVVICDESKLDKKRCNGAPDMVIEILSPSTAKYDKERKLNKYINAGVLECWIIDPDTKNVAVHLIDNGVISFTHYESDEIIPVHILEGCKITLQEVFKSI